MIYLDANFLAYFFFDAFEKGESARKLLQRTGDRLVTSVLALDELMWVIYKNRRKEEIRRIVEKLYSSGRIKVVPVGEEIPLMAVEFVEGGLKPRDAFHAAVMKALGIKEIISEDTDFDRLKWIKRIRF